MNPLDKIAEARIQEALAKGELKTAAGDGKRLELDDLSRVPDDLRAGYLLLKGSGYLPPELELRNECVRLADLIAACRDDGERATLRRRRNAALLRDELLMERRGARGAAPEYADRVADRLGEA